MHGRYGNALGGPSGDLIAGILGLVFTAVLIAATIIAIVMLVDAARRKGVEVKGAKLAGFWFTGIVLTPLMLALYVLCLRPAMAARVARVITTMARFLAWRRGSLAREPISPG